MYARTDTLEEPLQIYSDHFMKYICDEYNDWIDTFDEIEVCINVDKTDGEQQTQQEFHFL